MKRERPATRQCDWPQSPILGLSTVYCEEGASFAMDGFEQEHHRTVKPFDLPKKLRGPCVAFVVRGHLVDGRLIDWSACEEYAAAEVVVPCSCPAGEHPLTVDLRTAEPNADIPCRFNCGVVDVAKFSLDIYDEIIPDGTFVARMIPLEVLRAAMRERESPARIGIGTSNKQAPPPPARPGSLVERMRKARQAEAAQ